MSYEPKIEVVREIWSHYGASAWGTSQDGPGERAYLVRGLPMPGEKVVDHRLNAVGEVLGLAPQTHVQWDNGCTNVSYLHGCRPYDPDAERLRMATEAVKKLHANTGAAMMATHEDIARAVLDALKEVDDG